MRGQRAVRSAAAGVILLVVVPCASGCGAEGATTAPPPIGTFTPARRAHGTHGTDGCPLTIDGVRADIETTGRGSTVTLTASPDELMLLRARAHAVTGAAGGVLEACPCAAGGDAGAAPAAEVSVEDIEGGARIVVAARDPSDARTLGKLVRSQLALVHGGDCEAP